ncbi:MAG: hypothetical protein QXL94_05375 [Candidatus Parvarchaeum sp.]
MIETEFKQTWDNEIKITPKIIITLKNNWSFFIADKYKIISEYIDLYQGRKIIGGVKLKDVDRICRYR